MLKEHKFKVILSSIVILLPILFGLIMWNKLPGMMTTHWGTDGNADGFSTKVLWALNNEENWNKTHRLGGKVWVICGLAMLFSIFLPRAAMVPVVVCAVIAAAVIPILYSYCIYKKHQKEGIAYVGAPSSRAEK